MNAFEESERLLQTASASTRGAFYSLLLYHLSLFGRTLYVEAGASPQRSLVALRAVNEMMQVLSKQLLATLGGSRYASIGYPPGAFVENLQERARVGGIESQIEYPFRLSLTDFGQRGEGYRNE